MINLVWVAISEEVKRGVLLCVQNLVRDPVSTQCNFVSETAVRMLSEAAATSDSLTSSYVNAPWSQTQSQPSGQVIRDLTTCFEEAFDRRCVAKDTSKQWCALGAVRPSFGESSSLYGVHLSTVLEEGQIDYVPVVVPSRMVAVPSRHHSFSRKGKKKVEFS